MSEDRAAEQVDDDEPVAEGADDTEEEASAPDEESGIADGDFIKVAYTMRTVDDGRLVDTTDREIAEDDDIDTEGREFGPRT
ncbi:MAG: peptidylprolyl isomerase, partial [Halobacteriales archaeon]|nr:peptidylprolyl isomerase [Halobacteriales archaeon]